ncbi:MAG TPA: GvpL/GvpF family gas vesicle protein [Gemmatimonadaceae bacterium]|nr:GvpL/GvpF family gas vesicle protein [Gemmatimonadaceae bacterium]
MPPAPGRRGTPLLANAALRLYAIISSNGARSAGGQTDEFEVVVLRDLAAIVTGQGAYSLEATSDGATKRHRRIVDSVFRRHAVLPAPVGVVFRSSDALAQWLELHYATLMDGLSFVEDRRGARVHVSRSEPGGDEGAGREVAEVAAESFRAFRGKAAASIALRLDAPDTAFSEAYLVDRESWEEFTAAAAAQRSANPKVRIDVTGPWAPYDFIQMQFGA